MSLHRLIGCFSSKSGCWHHLFRRFHNLTQDAQRQVLRDLEANPGLDPVKAIRRAKRMERNGQLMPQEVTT